jgi:exosortase/archaeosortase family protein
MLQIIKANREKIQFFLGIILLYCIWHFGYEIFLSKHTDFNWKFNRIIGLQVSSWFTIFGGYETKVINLGIRPHLVFINDIPLVSIDTPCNGFPMIYLFCAFIMVYPAPWRRKLIFSIVGIFILHCLNLARIIGLSYNTLYSSEYFEFNHKVLFQIVVYSAIFSMWAYWLAYGRDNTIGWTKGIIEFIKLKFFTKLLKAI